MIQSLNQVGSGQNSLLSADETCLRRTVSLLFKAAVPSLCSHQRSVLWQPTFPQIQGWVKGVVSGWFKHIAVISLSVTPQIIRHYILEAGDPYFKVVWCADFQTFKFWCSLSSIPAGSTPMDSSSHRVKIFLKILKSSKKQRGAGGGCMWVYYALAAIHFVFILYWQLCA